MKVPKFSNPFEFDMLMLEPVHAMMGTGIRIDQAEKKRLQEEAIEENKDQERSGNAGVVYRNPENPPERKSNRRGSRR